MRAIQIDRHGGPEVLTIVDIPTPLAAFGQVLVKQTTAGVNFVDVYMRTGLYKGAMPFVPGREGAGVIAALGDGVTGFAIGDRVAYTQLQGGSYADYAVVDAQHVVPIPDSLDDRVACALMLQGFTAHYLATDTFPLRAGHVALVHAAAGGVGLLLVQLAKARGARVIGTVGTPEKAELARSAGADDVIVYAQHDFADATRELVGDHGVDVVYDSVGKDTWERSMSVLKRRGLLVVFGNASGPTPAIEPSKLMTLGSLYLTRPTLPDYTHTREEVLARAKELFDMVIDGRLHARIGATYPLADAAQAQIDLASRSTTGKLLLLI